jgi:hypothetical protein
MFFEVFFCCIIFQTSTICEAKSLLVGEDDDVPIEENCGDPKFNGYNNVLYSGRRLIESLWATK